MPELVLKARCLFMEYRGLTWEKGKKWFDDNKGKWEIVQAPNSCGDGSHSHVMVTVNGKKAVGYDLIAAIAQLMGNLPAPG